MNKKLKRLVEDEESTIARIEELQNHLKEIRIKRKQEEDLEIVRSFRSLKLGPRELLGILNGIQEGSVLMEAIPEAEPENEDVEAGQPEEKEEETITVTDADEASESEDIHD